MLLWYPLALVAFSQYTFSAPVPLEQRYLSWHSEPSVRGTWTLFSTCIITLSLCVYTAVHLNVPAKGTTQYWHRTKWVLVGILAPEVVVYCAWRQWSSAKQLTTGMHEIARKHNASAGSDVYDSSHDQLQTFRLWTMTHSFFAEMGGFVVKSNWFSEGAGYEAERTVLTAAGVLQLARLGYSLPSISKNAIKDRSKADTTAKLVAIVQAGYMALQEIARLKSRLPITMLEVNTIGHVLCAFVMYIFWLTKPLNVVDPVTVEGEWIQKLTWWRDLRSYWMPWARKSYMHFHQMSEMAVFVDFESRLLENVTRGHLYVDNGWILATAWNKPADTQLPVTYNGVLGGEIPPHLAELDVIDGLPSSFDEWKDGEIGLLLADANMQQTPEELRKFLAIFKLWPCILSRVYRTKTKLEQCANLLPQPPQQNAMLVCLTFDRLQKWDVIWNDRRTTHALRLGAHFTKRAGNWPSQEGHLQTDTQSHAIVFIALATALYGGLHTLLWNSHFPTNTERWLWRCCASTIAGSGLLAAPVILYLSRGWTFLSWISPFILQILEFVLGLLRIEKSTSRDIALGCLNIIIILIGACYAFCRLFLVIEAFISLRSLPAEAYITPKWTQWLPHL